MTVYVVAQFRYTDKAKYDQYVEKFPEIFAKYNGTLLINNENPTVLEGDWPMSKLVMMSFPSEQDFRDWAMSPEYLEIAKDRRAGSEGVVLLSEAFVNE